MCAQEGVLQRTRMHLTMVSPSSQMAVERISTHPTKFSKKNLAASERREEEHVREGEREREGERGSVKGGVTQLRRESDRDVRE